MSCVQTTTFFSYIWDINSFEFFFGKNNYVPLSFLCSPPFHLFENDEQQFYFSLHSNDEKDKYMSLWLHTFNGEENKQVIIDCALFVANKSTVKEKFNFVNNLNGKIENDDILKCEKFITNNGWYILKNCYIRNGVFSIKCKFKISNQTLISQVPLKNNRTNRKNSTAYGKVTKACCQHIFENIFNDFKIAQLNNKNKSEEICFQIKNETNKNKNAFFSRLWINGRTNRSKGFISIQIEALKTMHKSEEAQSKVFINLCTTNSKNIDCKYSKVFQGFLSHNTRFGCDKYISFNEIVNNEECILNNGNMHIINELELFRPFNKNENIEFRKLKEDSNSHENIVSMYKTKNVFNVENNFSNSIIANESEVIINKLNQQVNSLSKNENLENSIST